MEKGRVGASFVKINFKIELWMSLRRAGEMGLGPGGNRPGKGPPFERSEGPRSAERALSSVKRALSSIQRALLSVIGPF